MNLSVNRFLSMFELHAQIARQYNEDYLLRECREFVPYHIRNASVGTIATWFQQDFMRWNDSPALIRYNRLEKLLETREGRCGEWANVFTAMLNSLGREARLVLDYTDHVWTEVRMGAAWIHVDSTLTNMVDHPYFYEDDWKKPLSYIIAFSPTRAEDVTKNYARHWNKVEKRRKLGLVPDYIIRAYNHESSRLL